MAEPSNSESQQAAPAPPAKPRGRKKRRAVLAAAVIAALWAAGQGLGWFGSGPSGERGTPQGDGQSGAPDTGGGSGVRDAKGQDAKGENTNDPTGSSKQEGNPSPHPEAFAKGSEGSGAEASPHPGTAAAAGKPTEQANESTPTANASSGRSGDAGQAPSPTPGENVSSDRFASLLSLLDSHLQAGELGNASAALQRLRAQPLSEGQQQQLAALERRLQPLASACEQRVLDHVRNGQLLDADREAAQLVVGGVLQADRLTAAATGLGLAANWQAGIAKDMQDLPAPTPLLRNRKVRVRFRDRLRDGVVASSNRDEVTVRITTSRGKTFPTVKAIACEPADSTSNEAIEMGLAAVHAGAPRLARLWMLRAHLLKDELTTRGAQLLEMLR